MSGYLTPEAAKKLHCPLARTFAEKKGPGCDADKCPVWRWLPIASDDPRFSGAIKRECVMLAQQKADETSAKPKPHHLYHKQAVKNVMADPVAYGVPAKPEKGWCGLGGRPEK